MGKNKQLASTLASFGWPPIMRTAVACQYTCRSRWTLQRAVQAGELAAAGKNRRSLTFLREELDRWMLGGVEALPSEGPLRISARRPTPANSNALSRLRALKAGR